MLRAFMETIRRNREHRRRLRRAPELIMRAHLLMKDREIRELKRQLAETRQRAEGLEVDLYRARQANEDLVWARLRQAGLERSEEEATPSLAQTLDVVARSREGVAA